MRIILAKPRGFCAGVLRAIEIVERALSLYQRPVYVRHEIVHNKHVVDRLRRMGAIFVDDLDEVPEGALTIFSAHGVSRLVEKHAAMRGLDVIDATCPLVTRVHQQGRRFAAAGLDVILIGHRGHAEVEGTSGQIDGQLHLIAEAADVDSLVVSNPEKVAYITQTTLSVGDTREVIAALRRRFPRIVGQETKDICYATQNRQNAVLDLAAKVEKILVIGSANSSNSNRLRELGETIGVPTRLIDGPADLDLDWLEGTRSLGLTAGASAPETLVQDTIEHLRLRHPLTVETLDGIEETVHFRLPGRLATPAAGTRPASVPSVQAPQPAH